MDFSDLEKDILDWFFNHSDDYRLKLQLKEATLKGRDHTSFGFFSDLKLPSDVEKMDSPDDEVVQLPGPGISSPQLEEGAEANIFIKNGLIDCLEILSNGVTFPKELTVYDLKDHNPN